MFCHPNTECMPISWNIWPTLFCRREHLGKPQSHRKLCLEKALPSLPDVLCWHFPSESCARTGFCQSAVAVSLAPLGTHSFWAPQHPSPLPLGGPWLPDPWSDPEKSKLVKANRNASLLPDSSPIHWRNTKFHRTNNANVIKVLCQLVIPATRRHTHPNTHWHQFSINIL